MNQFQKDLHADVVAAIVANVKKHNGTPCLYKSVTEYLEKAAQDCRTSFAFCPSNKMLIEQLEHEKES